MYQVGGGDGSAGRNSSLHALLPTPPGCHRFLSAVTRSRREGVSKEASQAPLPLLGQRNPQ